MKYLYWETEAKSDILPLRIYVEIEDEMYERRKVEFFQKNEIGYADDDREVGRTILGDIPLPSIKELNGITSYSVVEITQEQFEKIWLEYAL